MSDDIGIGYAFFVSLFDDDLVSLLFLLSALQVRAVAFGRPVGVVWHCRYGR